MISWPHAKENRARKRLAGFVVMLLVALSTATAADEARPFTASFWEFRCVHNSKNARGTLPRKVTFPSTSPLHTRTTKETLFLASMISIFSDQRLIRR
jgi:hypothetical protein